MKTEVLICVTCRTGIEPPDQEKPGRALFELVQEKVFADNLALSLRPVECMSGCATGCAVAFQAHGKQSYVFGRLSPTEDAVNQLVACALQHQSSFDGVLPWADRPPLLKGCTLARLPALLNL